MTNIKVEDFNVFSFVERGRSKDYEDKGHPFFLFGFEMGNG